MCRYFAQQLARDSDSNVSPGRALVSRDRRAVASRKDSMGLPISDYYLPALLLVTPSIRVVAQEYH